MTNNRIGVISCLITLVLFSIIPTILLRTYDMHNGVSMSVVLPMYFAGLIIGGIIAVVTQWVDKKYPPPKQARVVVLPVSDKNAGRVKWVIIGILTGIILLFTWLIVVYVPSAKIGFTAVAYICGLCFGLLILLAFMKSTAIYGYLSTIRKK
ncbi:MAG: hypothetical protein Q7J08_03635 [Methanocorpusculum sp.]|uniref:hypothetical protein n=1 Tax=Methanocorpusculum sp. TaxID=2058474 RepID=UPI002722FA26|nr:hypothetical protein [Methanocorpusculum sp.]MDO9522786.1 hypothetical protein [Methanocorpusculum sp.]